jgi:hypothetical protein
MISLGLFSWKDMRDIFERYSLSRKVLVFRGCNLLSFLKYREKDSQENTHDYYVIFFGVK